MEAGCGSSACFGPTIRNVQCSSELRLRGDSRQRNDRCIEGLSQDAIRAFGGQDYRGSPAPVAQGRVGSIVEKYTDYRRLPLESLVDGFTGYFPESPDRLVERGEREVIPGGRASARGKDGLHALNMPVETRFMQSGIAFVVGGLNVGPFVQQQSYHREVALFRCRDQRGCTLCIACFDVRPSFKQELGPIG